MIDDGFSFEKLRMMCLLMIFYFCSPLKLSFMKRIATDESISMHCWFGRDALNPRTITYPFVNELNISMVRFFKDFTKQFQIWFLMYNTKKLHIHT